MKLHIATGLILSLAASGAFAATSMRCGPDLIQTGDTKLAVLDACGPPSEPDIDPDLLQTSAIERWVYAYENRFTYIVVFDGYRVERIEVVTE